MRSYEKTINNLAEACHKWSQEKGWWNDLEELSFNHPEIERAVAAAKLNMLQLEIKDTLEDLRTHDKLTPEVKEELEIRLTSALILMFDFAGAYKLDLGGTFTKVMIASAANKPKPKAIFIRKGQKNSLILQTYTPAKQKAFEAMRDAEAKAKAKAEKVRKNQG